MSTDATTVNFSAGSRIVRCPAGQIDASGPWLFWTAQPRAVLRRSVERHGQLLPVLVDWSGQGPVLLAGAARTACLVGLGRDVACLDMGRLDAWEKGLVYVRSNADRDLSDGQIVKALRYFQRLDPGRTGDVHEELGLEPRSRRERLVVEWLSLPVMWDRFLQEGHAPLACADLLAGFGPDGLEMLAPLFEHLSWSRGSAVNLLTWLQESSVRDGRTIRELMDEAGVEGILRSDLSPKDAMSRITANVRCLRFPRLSRMEQDFAATARTIAAGTRWRLIQPDQFESGKVELSVAVGACPVCTPPRRTWCAWPAMRDGALFFRR